MLEKSVTPFRTEIYKIDSLKDKEPTIEKMNKIPKESMDTIQNETQKSIIKQSTEDTETESLN